MISHAEGDKIRRDVRDEMWKMRMAAKAEAAGMPTNTPVDSISAVPSSNNSEPPSAILVMETNVVPSAPTMKVPDPKGNRTGVERAVALRDVRYGRMALRDEMWKMRMAAKAEAAGMPMQTGMESAGADTNSAQITGNGSIPAVPGAAIKPEQEPKKP
jgi:hypothetical protein